MDHIRANAMSSIFLELKKFCFFWSNYEVHDLDSTYKHYVTIRHWPLIPFGIIAALGIVGMGLSLKKFRQTFLIYWMVFIYLLSVLIFFAASRYRLPAVPFLSIFAAYTLMSLVLLIRDKNWKRLLVYSGISFFLVICTNFLFRDEIKKFDRWQEATRIHYSMGGKMLFNKGLYREAVEEFQRTLDLQPNFTPAYTYLGRSFAILEDYSRADECFQRVVQLAPSLDEGYMNLGLLYELQGQRLKAVSYLSRAISLNPQNTKAKSHLQALKAPLTE
jgi:tetratricopeptide (TPR) repeat protein